MFYNDDLKVKDLQRDDKGIFYYINVNKPLPFKGLIHHSDLDLGFYMLHGEKLLSPFVKDMFERGLSNGRMIELSRIINLMFHSKWETMFSLYEEELNLDTYRLETTEKVVETGERSSTRDDETLSNRKNLVSSFDNEVLQDKDNEVYDSNYKTVDTGNTNHNSDLTKIVKGNINNRLTDVTKIIRLLQDDLINDIIYMDVVQLIALSIY